jgi:tRNA-splicing ligase RtcB
MSTTKTKETILPGHVNKFLKNGRVELNSSGFNEAPMAYGDIPQVMNSQKDLIEVQVSFMSKIVRMCGDERFKEVD